MRYEKHPERDSLIDFVDGDLPPAAAREIETHVVGCEVCRAYVQSLRRALSVLEADRVPEPPETFYAYLAGRAKARASRSRRRLALRLTPGLAVAAAAVVLMWWLAGTPVLPVDSVDIIMADMTTEEIVEAASTDPNAGSLLVDYSRDRLTEIETYLSETGSLYELLDSMSDTERERFTAYLEGSMAGDGETSGLVTGSMRKEC